MKLFRFVLISTFACQSLHADLRMGPEEEKRQKDLAKQYYKAKEEYLKSRRESEAITNVITAIQKHPDLEKEFSLDITTLKTLQVKLQKETESKRAVVSNIRIEASIY